MENQRNPLLTWAYYCQGKTMDELKHSLLCTTLELENTKMAVQDELRKKEDQLIHFKDLLNRAIKERDEAQEKFQRVLFENLLLHQQQFQSAPISGISSIDDEQNKKGIDSNNGFSFSSSDCEESIVSSPIPATQLRELPELRELVDQLLPEKPLPEKGKLLQAVMKAGPLLQTLLLAGPLPQWRHPPPPLESFEIPPVTIPAPAPAPVLLQDSFSNGCSSRKRILCEGSDSPPETKYQRIVLH